MDGGLLTGKLHSDAVGLQFYFVALVSASKEISAN